MKLCYGIVPLSKESGEWTVFLIQPRGFEDYWSCPKGGIEAGETSHEAASRELKEETGLSVKQFLSPTPILEEFSYERNGERHFKRVHLYLAEVEGAVNLQQKEVTHGEWFSLRRALDIIIHPEGKATLQQVVAYLNDN